MRDAHPSLQAFLASLQERLATMTVEDLRERLLEHARSLPSSQRTAFLDIFTAKAPAHTRKRTSPSKHVEEDPLLAEIDGFVERLVSGHYFLGYGWDDEIRDERSFGDESWTREMDALLTAAQQAFVREDLHLARTAYHHLLGAFRLDEEIGHFCGPNLAVDMVATDVGEAEARYLRALYETTPQRQRADVLVDEWFDLPRYTPPTLRAVREALPSDLPALKDFLPSWMDRLQKVGGLHRADARHLLDEAIHTSNTLDGATPQPSSKTNLELPDN